jgi:hypothetical protein
MGIDNLDIDQYGVIAELCMRCGMFMSKGRGEHYRVYATIAGEIMETLHNHKYKLYPELEREFIRTQLYQYGGGESHER